jgi:hypothetical protein
MSTLFARTIANYFSPSRPSRDRSCYLISVRASGHWPSKLQGRAKVKPVAFESFAGVEVMDPARVEIEVALTERRGVGNDWAEAEHATEETIKFVCRRSTRGAGLGHER